MNLVTGVCLQSLLPGPLAASQITRSTGVDRAPDAGGNPVFYPRDDWRPLDGIEQQILTSSHRCELSGAVTLFKLDAAILETFTSEIRPMLAGAASMTPDERAARTTRFAERLLDEIRSTFGLEAQRIRSRDVYAMPGPSRSTSYDFGNRRYIGLHLDNHQRLPLAERPQAFQLLNLNCGAAHRYFQFINLTACQLSLLASSDPGLDEATIRNEAWRLKDRCLSGVLTDYPVVRVRLAPGEGYICVTQNIIHDGATNEHGEVDVSFLIGGWFRQVGGTD